MIQALACRKISIRAEMVICSGLRDSESSSLNKIPATHISSISKSVTVDVIKGTPQQ